MGTPLFYAAKISDIVYVTILYFVFGYYIAKNVNSLCDYIFGIEYLRDQLPLYKLIFEIIFQITISLYISRIVKKKIIDKLPFPLEGLGGFTHLKLKELVHNGGIAWGIGILLYQRSLMIKIRLLKKKFN
jgi:hypothetical protein